MAIDQWYHRRQKDAEGDFYRKIATQGPRKDMNGTTQGLYCAAPDGKLLGFTNNRSPGVVKRMLEKAAADFKPADAPALEVARPDPAFVRKAPEGGLVVGVTAKVLGGYDENSRRKGIFEASLARDNLWVRKDEHEALAKGQLPESLKRRIALFHLIDNTRGEPPMWGDKELKKLELTLADGRLTGTVHLETGSGDRGYTADLLGFTASEGGRVTRFDLVAKGDFWGEGTYTRGAPKGKYPLAVAFTLASGKEEADKVAPQGSKGWLPGYLR